MDFHDLWFMVRCNTPDDLADYWAERKEQSGFNRPDGTFPDLLSRIELRTVVSQ